jgi:hypothetical protein
MKALETDGGTIRDMALETVGLALTDKNLTICPELISPCFTKQARPLTSSTRQVYKNKNIYFQFHIF